MERRHAESVEDALTRRSEVTHLHLHDDDAPEVTLDARVSELPLLRSVYLGSNRSDIARASGLEALAAVATLRDLTIALDGPLKLPPAVFTLRPLTRLSLRGRWSALPDEVGALTQLLELELQLPHLHELPDSIGRLHDLRRLLLRDCRLRRLPDSVGDLAQLVDLFAEDNRLRKLPESVARLIALERLLLDGNRLREVPESLAALPRLRLLSLTRNDALDEVPQPLAARDGLSLEVEPEKLPLLVRESVEEASERAFSTLDASARAKERPAWTLQLDDAQDDQHEASVGGAMWLGPHESTPRCGICDAPMSPFLQLDLAMTGEHTGLLQVWGCGDAPSPTRLRQLAEQDVPTVSEVYREHLRAFFTLVPEAAWDGLIERARAWTTTPADRALLKLARLSGNTLEYTLRFTCRVLSSGTPCAYVFGRIVDRASVQPAATVGSPPASAPAKRRIAALERHVDRPASDDLGLRRSWKLLDALTEARRQEVWRWTLDGTKLGGWPRWRGDPSWPACPICGEETRTLVASIGGSHEGPLGPQLERTVLHFMVCEEHPRALVWRALGG
jgi:hypothetical protein